MAHFDILIVGTGHAGAAVAIALRQHGYAGSVAMIGDEPDPPYERPPLSKDYLAGTKSFERLLIRPPAFWSDRAVTLLPGQRVERVDAAARSVETHRGEWIGYGELVWAAGGTARPLTCAGGDLPGVASIRSRADADGIRALLPSVTRVAIVGGGYIGLEAAAAFSGLGKKVILVEAQDRVLARVAGPAVSGFFEKAHADRGVDIHTGAIVTAVVEDNGRAAGLRLRSGEEIRADLVIAGVGMAPSVAPLLLAGAEGGDGLAVDEFCRTSLPHVHAVGDCALHPNVFADGRMIRLESVQNAHDQATTLAKALTGSPVPYRATPWFWSDQFDLKLQTVGLSAGHDAEVVRGNPATRSFSVVYLKEGRVIAIDCVNSVRDYVQGRKLVETSARPSTAALSDPAVTLKDLLPAA